MRNDAPVQDRYDHLHSQVDDLADWILNNQPEQIDDNGACGVAVEMLTKYQELYGKLS